MKITVKDIFTWMRWPWLRGALHVYALPGQALREALVPFHEPIRQVPFCAVQPAEWFHATVTRLPWFLADPTIPPVADITAAVARAVATLPPFTLQLDGPRVTEYAVTVDAPASPEWTALVTAIRAAAAELDPGRELPIPPYAPHISVGYGIADGDDEVLREPLAAMTGTGPFPLPVNEVHLLAVQQDPQRGIFCWEPIAALPLGG
ncbi:2'-5' RNA ligase family protein [Pseudonocardia thermophila]|uniref:2'-5' RNA ligase family protein n=1 Tax=Pseudonocardia thermophila TaxID=1848 RepID=UPI0009371B18|nr:2'-5' RNA ligase family protein [Pseudonocardia thermophila]